MNVNTMDALLQFAQAAEPQSGGMQTMLFMGLFMIGFWFLLMAPQKKRQKEHNAMIEALQEGDKVITNSGIYGTIVKVKSEKISLRIEANTVIEVGKTFVQNKIEKSK